MQLVFTTSYKKSYTVSLSKNTGTLSVGYAFDDGSPSASFSFPYDLRKTTDYQTMTPSGAISTFTIPQSVFPAPINKPSLTASVGSDDTVSCTGGAFSCDTSKAGYEAVQFTKSDWICYNMYDSTDSPALTVNGTNMTFPGKNDQNYRIMVRYHGSSSDFPKDEVSPWSDPVQVYIPKIWPMLIAKPVVSTPVLSDINTLTAKASEFSAACNQAQCDQPCQETSLEWDIENVYDAKNEPVITQDGVNVSFTVEHDATYSFRCRYHASSKLYPDFTSDWSDTVKFYVQNVSQQTIVKPKITITCDEDYVMLATGTPFAATCGQYLLCDTCTFVKAEWRILNSQTGSVSYIAEGVQAQVAGEQNSTYVFQVRYHGTSSTQQDIVSDWSDSAEFYCQPLTPMKINTPNVALTADSNAFLSATATPFGAYCQSGNCDTPCTFVSAEWSITNSNGQTSIITNNSTNYDWQGENGLTYGAQVRYHGSSPKYGDIISDWSNIAALYVQPLGAETIQPPMITISISGTTATVNGGAFTAYCNSGKCDTPTDFTQAEWSIVDNKGGTHNATSKTTSYSFTIDTSLSYTITGRYYGQSKYYSSIVSGWSNAAMIGTGGTVVSGWSRSGTTVMYGGQAIADYYTHDAANPWTICMGSAAYDNLASSHLNSDSGIVNFSGHNCIFLGQRGWKVDAWQRNGGNDVLPVREYNGRLYSAILYNDVIGGATAQSPMMFYSDDNGATWCQYWSPARQAYPTSNVWNGDFWIFKKACTILGKSFQPGNVLWILAVQNNGVNDDMYMIQPTIDDAVSETGYLVQNGNFHGDPRFHVRLDNTGTLEWINNGGGNSGVSGYHHVKMNSWTKNDFVENDIIKGYSFKPPAGQYNYEVPAPILDTNLFVCNTQIVNVNGVWNTITNNTMLMPINYNTNQYLDAAVAMDIGYDTYAVGIGFNLGEQKHALFTTTMNWGNNNYPTMSYPMRTFRITSGNNLRYDIPSGFATSGLGQSNGVKDSAGNVVAYIYDNNGTVDIMPVQTSRLNWYAKWNSMPTVRNRLSQGIATSDVAGVYLGYNGNSATYIIQSQTGHDRTCNIFWLK